MNVLESIALGITAVVGGIFVWESMNRKSTTEEIRTTVKKMKTSIKFVSKKKFLLASPQMFANFPKQSEDICKLCMMGYLFSWWHLKKAVSIYATVKKLHAISIKSDMTTKDKEEQKKLLAFLMMELDLLDKKLALSC